MLFLNFNHCNFDNMVFKWSNSFLFNLIDNFEIWIKAYLCFFNKNFVCFLLMILNEVFVLVKYQYFVYTDQVLKNYKMRDN